MEDEAADGLEGVGGASLHHEALEGESVARGERDIDGVPARARCRCQREEGLPRERRRVPVARHQCGADLFAVWSSSAKRSHVLL